MVFFNVSLAMGIPPPQTLAAEAITATSAKLNGQAIPSTASQVTTDPQVPVFLIYKANLQPLPENTQVIATTPTSVIYPIQSNVPFSAIASGLQCGTAYSYAAGLSLHGGTQYDVPLQFTTLPCVPTPPPAPQPIPTLSEWAQLMMMLAMIATAGFYGWRMKQR